MFLVIVNSLQSLLIYWAVYDDSASPKSRDRIQVQIREVLITKGTRITQGSTNGGYKKTNINRHQRWEL